MPTESKVLPVDESLVISNWREVRCPSCTKLIARVSGVAIIELVCMRCKTRFVWPDLSKAFAVNEPVVKAINVLHGTRMVTAPTEIPPHV